MKNILIKIISKSKLMIFLLTLLIAGTTFQSSKFREDELEAGEILKKADAIVSPQCFVGDITMTAFHSNGESRVYKMRIYKNTREKVLVEFYYPEIEKGRKILRLKDEVWMYLPSVKKTMKVSIKEEMLGGDFTNGDITRLDLYQDYNCENTTGESDNIYYLKLKAKDRTISYDQILCQVNKDDFISISDKFYTTSGKHIKTLIFDDIKTYANNFRRPSKLTMNNELIKDKKTVLIYNSFEIKKYIKEYLFQKSNLGDF